MKRIYVSPEAKIVFMTQEDVMNGSDVLIDVEYLFDSEIDAQ